MTGERRPYKILKQWITKAGYIAVVIQASMGYIKDTRLKGHNNGYIGIPNTHPLYGKSYSEHCHCFNAKGIKGTIKEKEIAAAMCWDGNEKSMDMMFDVHGGITYTGNDSEYPIKSNLHWIGFDCSHLGDNLINCNLDFCIKECERLAEQIKEVE